jgi:hypothetical protein
MIRPFALQHRGDRLTCPVEILRIRELVISPHPPIRKSQHKHAMKDADSAFRRFLPCSGLSGAIICIKIIFITPIHRESLTLRNALMMLCMPPPHGQGMHDYSAHRPVRVGNITKFRCAMVDPFILRCTKIITLDHLGNINSVWSIARRKTHMLRVNARPFHRVQTIQE